MTVAAANKKWFPHVLGTVGQIGTFKVSKAAEENEGANDAMDKGESPMYVPFAELFYYPSNSRIATP